jgi:F-type H+-transporting ATPase subunit gamma
MDEDPVTLIDAIVPFCVSGLLYAAVSEAVASEHGARRNAMSSASKNAGELMDTLQLHYNRARQAAITQEISEIVSGSDAL